MGTFSVGASQTCFPHGIFHDLLHGSAIACLLSEWYCNCCTVIQTHYIYNLNPAHHNVIPCLESQASHEEKWSSMLSQGRTRRGRNHRLAPVDMGNKTRLLKYCWLQGWLCGIQPEILWFSLIFKMLQKWFARRGILWFLCVLSGNTERRNVRSWYNAGFKHGNTKSKTGRNLFQRPAVQ